MEVKDANNGAVDSHVTTEVFHEGDWILVDPTFKSTFTCGDSLQLLSAESAQRCVKNDGALNEVQFGDVSHSRSLDAYYIPYSKLITGLD